MRICISLTDSTTLEIVDRLVDLAPVADLFEIRADLITDLDMLTILRARTRPLVFTCLPRSEGGQWPDEDPNRRLRLLEAAKRGFDYVDVNLLSNFTDVMVEKAGQGLIVSYHALDGVPDDLSSLMAEMRARRADIAKIAARPRTLAEVGRLMAFAQSVTECGGIPLIPIAMGPLGLPTRLLGGRTGAPFTFAAAALGAEAAPGQIPAARMARVFRVREVGPDTRVYGLVGRDVTSSLSPVLHNAAFAASGINARQVPVEADSMDSFIGALPGLRLAGFSVTRPYKNEILPRLSEVDDTARAFGSVNTVTARDGRLCGTSTDGLGLLAALTARIDPNGKRVAIVGAGGAAHAAVGALTRRGAEVTVLSRRCEQARDLAREMGCAFADLTTFARLDWEILINATPAGSSVAPDALPVPAETLRAGAVVLDMVPLPRETPLLKAARQRGCVAIEGGEMLLGQAVAQFEIWTGTPAPVGVMREALEGALGGGV
jgi:3-dehydroquinate dehydratase / shikimate dehydrogenase